MGENAVTPTIGVILFVGSVLLLAIVKVQDRLAQIVRLLERANEIEHENRTGEWRERY